MRSMRKSLILILLVFATSCAAPAADCAWVKRIEVAQGDILGEALARQIVAHNRKVAEFCR